MLKPLKTFAAKNDHELLCGIDAKAAIVKASIPGTGLAFPRDLQKILWRARVYRSVGLEGEAAARPGHEVDAFAKIMLSTSEEVNAFLEEADDELPGVRARIDDLYLDVATHALEALVKMQLDKKIPEDIGEEAMMVQQRIEFDQHCLAVSAYVHRLLPH